MSDQLIHAEVIGGDAVSGLADAMRTYVSTYKKSADQAMRKAGREVAFALHLEFRKQPPRPHEGKITKDAERRGWRINPLSKSYLRGYSQALKMLHGAKSGYFRVDEIGGKGRIKATPVILGRKRNVILSSRKHVGKRGSLLTDLAQTTAGAGANVPENWRKLNVGSLAALYAIGTRERAGIGGYLSAQWLTYKKIKGKVKEVTVLTKNNVLAGEVVMDTDNEGNVESVLIRGRLPGSGRIAQRHGIIPKALENGAKEFVRDMKELGHKRAAKVIEAAKASVASKTLRGI